MQIDYEKIKRVYKNLKDAIEECNNSYAYDTSVPNTYSVKINGVPVLVLDDRVCFGALLNKYGDLDPERSSIFSCKLYINTVPRKTTRDRIQDNLTWMTKEQLIEHIKYIQDLGIKFNFKVKNYYRGWHKLFKLFRQPDGYVIKIKTKRRETSYPEMKYILFWIREAYRYPYCINLADTYTLKERYLPEEELFNLVTIPGTFYGPADENFPSCCSFISKEYLLQELKKKRRDISEIYRHHYSSIYGSQYLYLAGHNGIDTTIQLEDQNRWEEYIKVFNFVIEKDKIYGNFRSTSKM